ncbi:nucleotidyltransferase family protein [Sporosarcina thermotolerans]|uniref:Nucleotidyltransferase family protein n=2 Tax=Sporosarcina thermotolerans TaxID=633404 RepID=A0AAW9A5G1_9BACL|nr:nucleotidyltransferase family protein [Sporosarcina thermotolerans]MDW0116272.1 nucleotidyltransferase family protein [Sporosarcina thermotolerans]
MDTKFQIDHSCMSNELKLLLQIMHTENIGYVVTYKDDLLSEVDWELFLALARHHRIFPLLHAKLSKMDGTLIPSHVLHALNQDYKENTFQMLKLSGEMERISLLLRENGIRSLFLKGPVIANAIFGDISLRFSKDLDILIPKSDFDRTEEILVDNGYKKEDICVLSKLERWKSHHVIYYHPVRNVEIEIHWRLYDRPSKEPNFDELWERKRISELTSNPVHFLGEKDLFVYLVRHGAKHGWFRLRWLADIDQLISNGTIPLEAREQRRLMGQVYLLSSQLFKTKIPEELLPLTTKRGARKFAKAVVFYLMKNDVLDVNQTHTEKVDSKAKIILKLRLLYCQYTFKSNIQKAIFLLLLFQPNYLDIETLKLPKNLYFLYYPLKPFIWLWRNSVGGVKTKKIIQ